MKKLFLKIKDYFETKKTLGKLKLFYMFTDYEGHKTKVKLGKKIDLTVFSEDIIVFILEFLEKSNISVDQLYEYLDNNYNKAYDFKDPQLKIKPLDVNIQGLLNDKDFINNIKVLITNNDFLLRDMITSYLNHYSTTIDS